MARTFGQELLHFAQSVDIIDVETCDFVRHLLCDYFGNALRIDFYEVQTDGFQIEGRPGLRTCMTKNAPWTNGQPNSTVIRTQAGGYRDQTTFAYETRNILWVTEKDGEILKEDSECVNRWPHSRYSTPLPPYWPFVGNMRTQVVFPLQYGDRVFGILNLETERLLEYTPFAGEELRLVSNAIAIILWLHDTNLNQNVGTRKALEVVARSLSASRNPSPLVKPKIFVASSSRADDQVIGIIHRVINEHHNQVDEVFWKSITESGNITSQVLAALNECSLGVCYFSEPVLQAKRGMEYVDNMNVVFEAGILHALTNASIGAPKKWIPVREPQSPATPFDFASERMIIVSRLAGGALNEELFARELRERLAAALMA
jgi:hypothetical protein